MENAEAIIDAMERLTTVDLVGEAHNKDLALAVVPKGKEIKDLRPYLDAMLPAPKYIKTVASLTQVQSLIDYVNRFKLADSVLFVDDAPAKPSLFAVIDFHGGPVTTDQTPEGTPTSSGPDETPGSTATPRFGRHCARYDFPLSEQFRAWSAISGAGMSHVEMAEFLADRQYDIANPPLDWMQAVPETVKLILQLLNIHPDDGPVDDTSLDEPPAGDDDDRYIPRSALYKLRQIRFGSALRLLQMAKTVEISASAKAVEGYNPKTGERTIQFEESHETRSAGRKVTVPDGFLLRIPVFEGETPQLLPVRLQYRRGPGGGVKWLMTLAEWQRAVRFAVKTEAERAAKDTALALYYGCRSA